MIAFGPVPSRRLGRSLGINNIPPKVCTYSCVYCQVRRTHTLQHERCPFYEPEDIIKSVGKQVKKAIKKGEPIDYLTFVSDGEPTLDANLGYEIDLLKSLRNKIRIFSNLTNVRVSGHRCSSDKAMNYCHIYLLYFDGMLYAK